MNMAGDCIFCKIAKGEIPCEKIYWNDRFFSIFDAHPWVEGHALVISKKHFEDVLRFPKGLGDAFIDCVRETANKLVEKYFLKGFNLVHNNGKIAGQMISHFHMHIVPRREGDGLKLNGLD